MTLRTVLLSCILIAFVAGTGCKKETQPPAEVQPAPAPSTPVANNSAASTAPSATATSTSSGSPAETTAKLAGAEWAMKQDAIKNDPNGQWAIGATASSTYNDAHGQDSWSANQAAGAPNVEKYGDDGKAWTSKTQDTGIEWIELTYPKPVHATEVRIRESFGSGAVVKVELTDEQGAAHVVWAGNDPTTELNYLLLQFPKTDYKSGKIKVTLATNVVAGWNEIDAVQLVGTDQ